MQGPSIGLHGALRTFLAFFALSASFEAHAQVSEQLCGSLAASFGPYDYRADHFKPQPGDQMPHSVKLKLVEDSHFDAATEHLFRGISGRLPGGDLEYTLRVFPNHHRALVSIMNLWERTKAPQPPGMTRPVECFFERALRFQPDDNIVRLLYSSFLVKGGRKPEAAAQLEAVKRQAGENAFTHYNIGMVYADAGMFEEALVQAHHAMALGLGRPELRQRLVAAGSWKDPPPAASEPSASSTSSPSPALAPTK